MATKSPDSTTSQSAAASQQNGASTASAKNNGSGNVDELSGRYLVTHLPKRLVQDQVAIWTSPFRMNAGDLKWQVPFAGITTGLIMTDRTASFEATRRYSSSAKTFSDFGLYTAAGSTAGFYLLGRWDGDRRQQETGVLGGEAMVNALAVTEVLKYAFQRERPYEGGGAGRFFQGFSHDSFPSGHATLSFALASVVAHEYPGWLTEGLAYGGASAISLARVVGKQHFPSDVFVGGTLGYLTGRYVYRAHHDKDFDDSAYGTFEHEHPRVTFNDAGSTYVEPDSWIYPAVERLIALNVIRRPFLGLRPWTRTAIALMLAEARPLVEENSEIDPQIKSLYEALKTEFSQELGLENGGVNESIRLESVYSKIFPIAGTPLNDSYHFGQTIINDYGRPYWQGFNSATGFTARAETGHFSFYARGEYQNSPGAPDYSPSVQNTVVSVDLNCQTPGQTCPQPASPSPAAHQFRLLDTYVGLTAIGNQISVGKQSLWWGTGDGSAMIFSDNAEPIYMLRLNRTVPLYIPLISKLLGPMRYDNFFGKLSGHHFPPDPYMYGDKISFQPTENLEFGFSRTAVFAGQGKTPLTFGTFGHSFISANDVPISDKGTPRDPGARHGAFDFSYKLPFLRNWVTLYSDSIAHDEPNPVAAPRRAAIVPGIYVSHFPKLNKLDLRVESGYTDISPIYPLQEGRFLYWELVYRDAYTNKGNLLGSWMGRQGKGTQVWTNYWLNPHSTIQLSYRKGEISPDFIPGGGNLSDFAAGARWRVRSDLEVLANFQYEQWDVPVLAPGHNSDFLTSIQVTFWPKTLAKTAPAE